MSLYIFKICKSLTQQEGYVLCIITVIITPQMLVTLANIVEGKMVIIIERSVIVVSLVTQTTIAR